MVGLVQGAPPYYRFVVPQSPAKYNKLLKIVASKLHDMWHAKSEMDRLTPALALLSTEDKGFLFYGFVVFLPTFDRPPLGKQMPLESVEQY